MTRYTVRPARGGDARTIAEIHAQATHAGLAATGAPANPEAGIEKRRAFWRAAVEHAEPILHVVLGGEEVVGFVGYDRCRDEGTPPTTGEIWVLHVLPSHWGRGAGDALCKAALEGLSEEGCTESVAWVPLVNERALAFFERAGFEREAGASKTVTWNGVELQEARLRLAVE